MSLIEVIVAMAILVAGGWASMMALSRMSQTSVFSAKSSMATEIDQAIRYEVTRTFDMFQRAITEKGGENAIKDACKLPYETFKKAQYTESTIMFGVLSDIINDSRTRESFDTTAAEIKTFRDELRQLVNSKKIGKKSSRDLDAAFQRCATDQSIKAGANADLGKTFYTAVASPALRKVSSIWPPSLGIMGLVFGMVISIIALDTGVS